MKKRGQVALFVIVGILLVAAIVLVFVFRNQLIGLTVSPEEAQRIVTSQIQPVRDYTDNCMLIAAGKILNTMGRQGGYVIPRDSQYDIPPIIPDAPVINYALFYNAESGYVNNLPSVNEMRDEFADYLEANFDFTTCIDDYSAFEGVANVQAAGALPTVDRENLDIGETSGQIVVPYKYPATISLRNASAFVEDYELVIPINIARIRELAARITNDVASGKNYITTISEEGAIEWEQARANPNSEKLFTTAEAYTQVFSDSVGVDYNEKNLLFKINYENPGLENPYTFYFLVGLPA